MFAQKDKSFLKDKVKKNGASSFTSNKSNIFYILLSYASKTKFLEFLKFLHISSYLKPMWFYVINILMIFPQLIMNYELMHYPQISLIMTKKKFLSLRLNSNLSKLSVFRILASTDPSSFNFS